MNTSNPLVGCEWLEQHINDPNIAILDCTFFLPNQERRSFDEYTAEHLPSARFFDIDKIADSNSSLPHMLPAARDFATAVGDLGIDNDTLAVVYDNNSFMASARVWWMFRTFGHSNVLVLDGGMKRWKSRGGSNESVLTEITNKRFAAEYNDDFVVNADQMISAMKSSSHHILDARSPQRFAGSEQEPRPGLRSGHIPGSINLHYNLLVNSETGELKKPQELTALLSELNVSDEKPMVTTCGSGVTASIIALALYCLGYRQVAVYDGSWAEWGSRSDTPIETG